MDQKFGTGRGAPKVSRHKNNHSSRQAFSRCSDRDGRWQSSKAFVNLKRLAGFAACCGYLDMKVVKIPPGKLPANVVNINWIIRADASSKPEHSHPGLVTSATANGRGLN